MNDFLAALIRTIVYVGGTALAVAGGLIIYDKIAAKKS